jgi:SAM-dependent methyltransferase
VSVSVACPTGTGFSLQAGIHRGPSLCPRVAEHLPSGADRYDVMLSTHSFHHWHDQSAGIAEVGRVLASDGHVLLADPFAIGWLRPYASLIGKRASMP